MACYVHRPCLGRHVHWHDGELLVSVVCKIIREGFVVIILLEARRLVIGICVATGVASLGIVQHRRWGGRCARRHHG